MVAAGMCLGFQSAAAEQSAARQWNEQCLVSIRLNVPNPPAHARNLFHLAVGMYNSWAAYDSVAVGYLYNEKVAVLPPGPHDVEAARREAISYAAYRILKKRFETGPDLVKLAAIHAGLDQRMTTMGYSPVTAQSALTASATPAELGKRIGQAILDWQDGFSITNFPAAYNAAVNPNMTVPLSVMGEDLAGNPDMPLGLGIPANTNPNFWQPLQFSVMVDQFGNPLPGGLQSFVGVQGLAVTPFSLSRSDPTKPWIDPFGGPSRLSVPGHSSPTDQAYKQQALEVIRASSRLNDSTVIDISPAAIGNNPLGLDSGTGYSSNPVTGLPYAPNTVKRSDYVRVLAEFWADGPNSETPPGHWHVIANEIADHPQFVKRIRGIGPVLGDLEWDVKMYLALSAATHDASCAAWSLKRHYHGPRPITMIRYMGSKGQSSDPLGPSYHSQGLPLEPGVVEVITSASSAAGQRHHRIWSVSDSQETNGALYIGKIAVYSWPGEHPLNLPAPSIATLQSMVRWQLARDWLPFQRKTFNTPAFPGYVSGHSTFSRAAAESLTLLTGSPWFPGGFHEHTFPANTMQIDLGPSADVKLQWASYFDAADQAGQSRRWGGIHPSEDDLHGRHIGSDVGRSAYTLAEQYWTGEILKSEMVRPSISFLPNGTLRLSWKPTRGMYHKVQTSNGDFSPTGWTDATTATLYHKNGALAGYSVGEWIDNSPAPGRKFYRIVRTQMP